MKTLLLTLSLLSVGTVFAADSSAPAQSAAVPSKPTLHRYLIERTFPKGALDGRDAAKANAIAVDSVMEVPQTLLPK